MILVILMMVITVVVLITGIVFMARGGAVNKKYASKLMAARVIFQLLAVICIGLMYMFAK